MIDYLSRLTTKIGGGRRPRYPHQDLSTVRFIDLSAGWLQQFYKALLLKMSVSRQCIRYSTLTHQNKTDCITQ
jgi:hypothetical protein